MPDLSGRNAIVKVLKESKMHASRRAAREADGVPTERRVEQVCCDVPAREQEFAGISAAFGDLRFGVRVDCVPEGGDGVAHECERDAAFDCLFEPVPRFADAGDERWQ